MDPTRLANQSEAQIGQSTLIHAAVSLASVDYETPGKPFKGLFLAAAGNVIVKGVDGTNTTFTSMPAGWNPCGGIGIIKTGTTATGIVALF